MLRVSYEGLPDPASARQVISDAVPLLGPRIGAQVQARAEAVRLFLERDDWSAEEAVRLFSEIASGDFGTWRQLLGGFYPPGGAGFDVFSAAESAISAARRCGEACSGPARPDDPYWEPELPSLYYGSRSQLRAALAELDKALVMLAGALTASPPRLALPARHPPGFARLHENVAAETVTENLAALIDEATREYRESLGSAWRSVLSSRRMWHSRIHSFLGGFVTDDVRRRYLEATHGFDSVERLAYGGVGAGPVYQEIARDIHPRIYSSYLVISISYLAEVQERMPDYAEASGQGKVVNALTGVLTSLARAANELSTVRYMTADPAMASAVAGDSRAWALLQVLADHLAAIRSDSQ